MEDFAKMMGQMKEVQASAQEIQQKLDHLQATGNAGAGAVSATVNGHKSLLKLDIDPEYINAEEKEMLQDLIVAAVNLAQKAVEEKVQEEIKQHTQGMLGGLPIDLMM